MTPGLSHPLQTILRCFGLALSLFPLPERAGATVPFAETGMVSFADWNPDNTGSQVVSDLLQQAIDTARSNHQTLFIPPGTYLIDRTITLYGNDGGDFPDGHTNVFGDPQAPPTFRLQDGTFTGSPAASNASPAFNLVHVDPTKGSAWVMFATFRNIRIDLGHNPGAAGIAFPAAQDSHLINVHVVGQSFTTGFLGLSGRNQTNLDLGVEGGRYGALLTDAVGFTINGLRLFGQTEVGLLVKNARGATVVGFEYQGPGIAIQADGGNYESGNLYLEDAKISLTGTPPAAIDATDRPMVLRNVFVRGAPQVVLALPRGIATANPDDWSRIVLFANSPSPTSDDYSVVLSVEGSRDTNAVISEVVPVTAVPTDLVGRHLPSETFAFNHPEAVNALSFPGATVGQKIQAALNSSSRVIYVPAGHHSVDTPLLVPLGKVLVGDPGKYSFLVPTYMPASQTYLITTEAGVGEVVLESLFLAIRDIPFDGGLHWQNHGGYWLNGRIYPGSGRSEFEGTIIRFSGDAGGSLFALTDHRNLRSGSTPHPDFRKMVIDGTHHPLTFYGLNLERGGTQRFLPANPFLDVLNSRNLRIYGMKSEPDEGTVVSLRHVDNVLVASFATHRDIAFPFFEIVGAGGLEIALLTGLKSGPPDPIVLPYTNLTEGDVLVRLQQGEGYRPDAFHAPQPGRSFRDTATSVGQNWQYLRWFGLFWSGPGDWIFHRHLCWLYICETNAAGGAFLYSPALGWLWTRPDLFPYLWRFASEVRPAGWLTWHAASSSPAWFFDWSATPPAWVAVLGL